MAERMAERITELNTSDYKAILEYYELPIPKSKNALKTRAEDILANKLCKCIKKIEPKNEARTIGICTKTVINRKGIMRGKFSCKGKRTISLKKKNNRI